MVNNLKIHFLMLLTILLIAFTYTERLKVHVVPHSHDDVGWLKTMDGYYIERTHCVKCILDNIYNSLKQNPVRTFTYVEMAYFEKWYTSQPQNIKNEIKQFIKEKRLIISNGGWVMNDEACTVSQDIIDQIRLGWLFLKNEFNIQPKVAWYLDPFGHSKTNAAILAQLGFKNLVIVRIDYKDKEIRKTKKEMEFIWRPYFDVNEKIEIFTHITYDHYSPRGKIWDNMLSYNLSIDENKAKILYDGLIKQSEVYLTNNLLFLYGDDFTFAGGSEPFKNMEGLMDYFNNHSDYKDKIELVYSTPIKYFEEIQNVNINFPKLKNFDFFPYSDEKKAYWTGYFSSRPYLKGMTRDLRKYLEHSSNFFIKNINRKFINNKSKINLEEDKNFVKDLFIIRKALAIAQHHDAVTGTAREIVSEDYLKMMENSIEKIRKSYTKILFNSYNTNTNDTNKINNLNVCVPSAADFNCNENLYEFNSDNNEKVFIFINFNYGTNHNNILPIHIKTNTENIKLFKINTNYDEFIEINNNDEDIKFDKYCYENEKECYLSLLLTFSDDDFHRIIKIAKTEKNLIKIENKINFYVSEDDKIIENLKIYDNEEINIKFNIKKGFEYITKNDKNNNSYKFSFNYGTYSMNEPSLIRTSSDNRGGAYIMATTTEFPNYLTPNISKSFYFNLLNLFLIVLDYNFCKLKIFIYKTPKLNYIIETQTVMYPIEENDKEYLLIIKSDINNFNENFKNLDFYTDTNGSILIQRVKDFRFSWKLEKDEVVNDNFYPVNSVLSIKDNSQILDNNKIFSIWNDRSQSATSIKQGEIYFVLNRKSSKDDQRGLADGLYENRNKIKNYNFNHFITIGDKFNQKLVNDLINKKPIIFAYENNSKINFKDNFKNLNDLLINLKSTNFDFILYDNENSKNCFTIDYFILDENKFILQLTNKFSELFFNNYKINKCGFTINYDIIKSFYKVFEVELNGINKIPINLIIENKIGVFTSFRETQVRFIHYSIVTPFEMKTFLFEKIIKLNN